jgi:hypothetical protein
MILGVVACNDADFSSESGRAAPKPPAGTPPSGVSCQLTASSTEVESGQVVELTLVATGEPVTVTLDGVPLQLSDGVYKAPVTVNETSTFSGFVESASQRSTCPVTVAVRGEADPAPSPTPGPGVSGCIITVAPSGVHPEFANSVNAAIAPASGTAEHASLNGEEVQAGTPKSLGVTAGVSPIRGEVTVDGEVGTCSLDVPVVELKLQVSNSIAVESSPSSKGTSIIRYTIQNLFAGESLSRLDYPVHSVDFSDITCSVPGAPKAMAGQKGLFEQTGECIQKYKWVPHATLYKGQVFEATLQLLGMPSAKKTTSVDILSVLAGGSKVPQTTLQGTAGHPDAGE